MSVYEPNSRHLREVLIFCFNMKKSAAEAHRMLSNTYGEAAISERTCREWFQRFKNVEHCHAAKSLYRVSRCIAAVCLSMLGSNASIAFDTDHL